MRVFGGLWVGGGAVVQPTLCRAQAFLQERRGPGGSQGVKTVRTSACRELSSSSARLNFLQQPRMSGRSNTLLDSGGPAS